MTQGLRRRWGCRIVYGAVLGLVVAVSAPARTGAATIVVLGDSLSAGFGIDIERGWVRRLAARLAAAGRGDRVVNASISGDTTRGGRARIGSVLAAYRPDIVILELGGNDGLRGLPLARTRDNLASIIRETRASGAEVLLVGMRIPPNYGPKYTARFHAIYRDLARRLAVPLVPFLLDGVAGQAELMQADGIHPRVEGQERMLDNVWPYLEPLL